MNKKARYDRIESYLLGKMSPEDRAIFEAELLANPQLAQSLTEQEKEHKIMEVLVEKDLKKDLKDWKVQADSIDSIANTSGNEKSNYPIRTILFIAVFLMLLVSVFLWYNVKNDDTEVSDDVKEIIEDKGDISDPIPKMGSQIDSSKLKSSEEGRDPGKVEKADAPELIPGEIIPSSDSNYYALADFYGETIDFSAKTRDEQSSLGDAMNDFEQGQFEPGIEKLNAIIAKDSTNLNAIYNAGLAYYHQRQFEQALPYLKIISQKFYLYAERAEWLSALTYLQINEHEAAEKQIKEILNDPEHAYYNKANALLRDLEALPQGSKR